MGMTLTCNKSGAITVIITTNCKTECKKENNGAYEAI